MSVADWVGKLFAGGVGDAVKGIGSVIDDLTTQDEERLQIELAEKRMIREAQLKGDEIALEQYRSETVRLQSVNETMRAELQAESTFKSGWRPAFGYACALAFFLQMVGLTIAGMYSAMSGEVVSLQGQTLLVGPQNINALAAFVGATFPLWGVGLSVLGVAVYKRSDDKALAQGVAQQGVLGAVADRIRGAR